jgi:hypothetical protein
MCISKSNIKFLLLTTISLCWYLPLNTQMKICGPNSIPPNRCEEACVYCNIDGLKGRNTTLRGNLPPTFCTPATDNAQWIAFVAATHDVTVEVSVNNCVKGDGLETALFTGDGCSNMAVISSCFTDVNNNTKVRLVSVLTLTIGQIYWLLIDGNNGDVCNWEVKVTEGSTVAPFFEKTGQLIIEDEICFDKETNIKFEAPLGSVNFDWTINGDTIKHNQKDLRINFNKPGEHVICVTAYNGCYRDYPVCKKIIVPKPIIDSITVNICANEVYSFMDKNFQIGRHLIRIPTPHSCDSLLLLIINLKFNIDRESPFLVTEHKHIYGENFSLEDLLNPVFDRSRIVEVYTKDIQLVTINDSYLPSKSENIYIKWNDGDQCMVYDSIYIEIEHKSKILAPNVIKKNSITNFVFTLRLNDPDLFSIETLTFYDRWGRLIVSKTSNEVDINSFCHNCESTIFVWKAELTDKFGKKFTETGSVFIE